MRDGSTVTADVYVSAMPVDIVKRMTPVAWQKMPYFRQVRSSSSPPHFLTSSLPRLLASSPPRLLASSPPHLLTSQNLSTPLC